MISNEASEPGRRRWQFTLRTVLLAVLPVALALGLWQARRQWHAAHFIRVDTSGGRVLTSGGQSDCDLLVKLRCSQPFTCVIEHIGRGHDAEEASQGATTCRSQAIGSRSSDRYGVDLRILYRDGTVSIFSDATARGNPVLRRDMRVQGLQISNLVTCEQATSSLPFDTSIRVLRFEANFDDPESNTSGSASDEFVIRVHASEH